MNRREATPLAGLFIAAVGFVALFVGFVLGLGAFLGGNEPMLSAAGFTMAAGALVYVVGRVVIWRWMRR